MIQSSRQVAEVLSRGVGVSKNRLEAETVAVKGSRQHVAVRQQHLPGVFTPTAGCSSISMFGMKGQQVQVTRQQRELLRVQLGCEGGSPLQSSAERCFDARLAQLA